MAQKHKSIEFLEIPSEKNPPSRWIFLFHGYGADAYDLRSLGEVLTPNDQSTHWIFPQGILAVPIGPGWTGRAWWNIDLNRWEQKAQAGEYDWVNLAPETLPQVREMGLKLIENIAGDWSKVILGGFSQGAMLACDLFLNAPQTPKGLMLFSPTIIDKQNWQKLIPNRKGSRFFMSHGRSDAVLPFKVAAQMETLLTQGGMKGSLLAFDGTHEIPPQAVFKAREYLASLE